jgi:CDP-diacylglycerol--glycerol-3-phosphate 3-phosphatidyltransferase
MKFFKDNKHTWIIPIYGLFYMICFILLEQISVKSYIIQCPVDKYIPFCEYFVVPYVLWFVFIAVTIWYFAFRCENRKEYWQFAATMITGMTVFLVISFVYPNGQNLRPVLQDGNVFTQIVKLLYKVDTATNVFPSMHVFNAVACCAALCRNQECKKNKKIIFGVGLLTILIVLSTVFIKQHSVIDVLSAFVLYAVCYQLYYVMAPQYLERFPNLLKKTEVLTIPNLLSVFRLVLAVVFMGIYQRCGGMEENRVLLTGIMILSGVTDFLDGKIARKYNMVSELGKILDPFADKVTQGALLLCLSSKYKLVRALFVFLLLKEWYTTVQGMKTSIKRKVNDGAQWYGKISTAVFYVIMIALLVFPQISDKTANILLLCCGGFMLLSFVMYARYYRGWLQEVNGNARERKRNYAEHGKEFFKKDKVTGYYGGI